MIELKRLCPTINLLNVRQDHECGCRKSRYCQLQRKIRLNEAKEQMRLLFFMEQKDYGECTHTYTRNPARNIVIRNGQVAMVHSLKYDHYKFPGGGIEDRETALETMIRETREETGLVVIPETVKEYGYEHRVQKSEIYSTECFVQDNFYFLCEAMESLASQYLDEYEVQESYRLELVEPAVAVKKNRMVREGPDSQTMCEREALVPEMLIAEEIIK